MQLDKNGTLLDIGSGFRLTAAVWKKNTWVQVPLRQQGDILYGTDGDAELELHLCATAPETWKYTIKLRARTATRVQLALEFPSYDDLFHLIPGCIFGDNNLSHAPPGHFPNLTGQFQDNISCAPYWEMRADRASVPLSSAACSGWCAGISTAPFSSCKYAETSSREGFVRNGVFSRLAYDGQAPACGITLGYRNLPCSFINKDTWGVPTEHLLCNGETEGRIFIAKAADRRGLHELIRTVYYDCREPAAPVLSERDACTALTRAFLEINWQPDKEHFANLNTLRDPRRQELQPWRTLAEIGWTGGATIAYPLLAAGTLLGRPAAVDKAVYLLDWVARAWNPASGLLWDVCGKHEGQRLNWWWSGYLVKDVHCAYTNSSALFYLLKSWEFCREKRGEERQDWLATALKALDTVCQLQLPDGNFGYTYAADAPRIVDPDGFVGAQFAAALALAWRATGEKRYLEAAARGMTYYAGFVRNLECWGAPMDTWKANDQEGILGFIRAARLLHESTGRDEYLEMLADSAEYEYLWRHAMRSRPEYPPLKGSPWSACGGSTTSVSNPHIHPMGLLISADLEYLAAKTGDEYHRKRWLDGLLWARNTVGLYPEHTGYGCRGVISERWCQSDGLTIETYPDGTPSSIGFTYNGWAAMAMLEGLLQNLKASIQ